jgi:hypothetical protein
MTYFWSVERQSTMTVSGALPIRRLLNRCSNPCRVPPRRKVISL